MQRGVSFSNGAFASNKGLRRGQGEDRPNVEGRVEWEVAQATGIEQSGEVRVRGTQGKPEKARRGAVLATRAVAANGKPPISEWPAQRQVVRKCRTKQRLSRFVRTENRKVLAAARRKPKVRCSLAGRTRKRKKCAVQTNRKLLAREECRVATVYGGIEGRALVRNRIEGLLHKRTRKGSRENKKKLFKSRAKKGGNLK